MVVGEPAVDVVEQQDVPARNPARHRPQDVAAGAVARVPGDGQVAGAVIVPNQPVDIGVGDRAVASLALARPDLARRRAAAHLLALRAVPQTGRAPSGATRVTYG